MQKELLLEIITERWSPYSFSSEEVEDYKLKAMFEAAACAPSSNNEQPWIFVFSTRKNQEIFSDYLEFLVESNREWAQHAYALVISLARTSFARNQKPNRYAFHDTGMAVGNLLTQALALDVYVHQMGGFSIEKVKDYFHLPEDIEPVAVLAVGYLGDGTGLPQELLKRDEIRRSRKQLKEYVFKNDIDTSAF